jgi:hypothetical protein
MSKRQPTYIPEIQSLVTAWEEWLATEGITVDPDESAAICTHWIHAHGARVPLLPAALNGKYQQFAKYAGGLSK